MRVGTTWMALLLAAAACREDAESTEPPENDDLVAFEALAQPPLARSCAFPACHAADNRGLSLYALGRRRLAETPSLNDIQYAPLTADEVRANLASALLFVDAEDPDESELLLRTLAVPDGGRGHRGGVFYSDRDDPEFQSLQRWVREVVP